MKKLMVLCALLVACAQPVKAEQGVEKTPSELELCRKEAVKLEQEAMHWNGLYNSLAKDELKVFWKRGEMTKVFLTEVKKKTPNKDALYYCLERNKVLVRSASFFRKMFEVLNGTPEKK